MSNKQYERENKIFAEIVCGVVESGYSARAIENGVKRLKAEGIRQSLVDILANCIPMKD